MIVSSPNLDGCCPATYLLSINGYTETTERPPRTMAYGCLVKLNETMVFAYAGSDRNRSEFKESTFLFDIEKKEWIRGKTPSLPTGKGRVDAACGMITDIANPSTRYVVLAGGMRNSHNSNGKKLRNLFVAFFKACCF